MIRKFVHYWRLSKCIVLALIVSCPLAHADDGVENASNLERSGRCASIRETPVVLVFTRTDCAYCASLKKQVIAPLVKFQKGKKDIALIREVVVDSTATLIDFQGEPQTAERIAKFYDVTLYPTTLIVDHRGIEITKRIVGYAGSEYASFYLEKNINSALEQIRVDKIKSGQNITTKG